MSSDPQPLLHDEFLTSENISETLSCDKSLIENWKIVIIDNIEHQYLISDIGRVWSLISKRYMTLSPFGGYYRVGLSYKGNKTQYLVHRLVALMFIPNPHNLPLVNHLDGDRMNNHVSNLEWLTPKENSQHAKSVLKTGTRAVPVEQYSVDGTQFIARFASAAEAARFIGTKRANITNVCVGKYKTSKGFVWKYADPNYNKSIPVPDGIRIDGYPNYIITDMGQVYSLFYNKYLCIRENGNNYQFVTLSKKGQMKNFFVHVLVARHFILNPDPLNKTQINHKDSNRRNNIVTNLEWVTPSENMRHATTYGDLRLNKVPVIQYSLDGKELARFSSITEAADSIGECWSVVKRFCTGESINGKGYIWKLAD